MTAPFFDVVMHQRACREFTAQPVSDDDLHLVLTAASHAPSAMNHQPWVFVIVRDPAARQSLVTVISGWIR